MITLFEYVLMFGHVIQSVY